MSDWREIHPGYWIHPEPIDETAARELMEERLAERYGAPRDSTCCRICGRPRRWWRHISSISGRCARCVARGAA